LRATWLFELSQATGDSMHRQYRLCALSVICPCMSALEPFQPATRSRNAVEPNKSSRLPEQATD
jgi:hypothetical protein